MTHPDPRNTPAPPLESDRAGADTLTTRANDAHSTPSLPCYCSARPGPHEFDRDRPDHCGPHRLPAAAPLCTFTHPVPCDEPAAAFLAVILTGSALVCEPRALCPRHIAMHVGYVGPTAADLGIILNRKAGKA